MLKIFKPCDFHVHLREGQLLKYVLKENNKNFQKILVMPNLIKPITNKNILSKYRSFVLNNNNNTEILFTIYLNQDCSIIDLKNMVNEKLFFAAKLYPLHATTNSSSGVKDIKKMSKYFEFLENNKIPLCLHGEHIHENDDPYEREKRFLDFELSWLVKNFKGLKITLEHITTKDSVDFVKSHKNIAATITTHHLLENTNTFLGNFLRPEIFCKPVIKSVNHQKSLLNAALSGNSKFFFGSDSAHILKIANLMSFVVLVYIPQNILSQIYWSSFTPQKSQII